MDTSIFCVAHKLSFRFELSDVISFSMKIIVADEYPEAQNKSLFSHATLIFPPECSATGQSDIYDGSSDAAVLEKHECSFSFREKRCAVRPTD